MPVAYGLMRKGSGNSRDLSGAEAKYASGVWFNEEGMGGGAGRICGFLVGHSAFGFIEPLRIWMP